MITFSAFALTRNTSKSCFQAIKEDYQHDEEAKNLSQRERGGFTLTFSLNSLRLWFIP